MKVKGTKKQKSYFFFFHHAFLLSQALESQLSRLTGGLSQDMKTARELLNLSDEAIPEQICRDLAAAHLELETNFDAVSLMCAERSHALVQALDSERVSGVEIHEATLGPVWNIRNIYFFFLGTVGIYIPETSELHR